MEARKNCTRDSASSWNTFYDGVLQLKLPVGFSTVGFADDLVVLVTALTLENVEVLMSTALGRIKEWMAANVLDLSLAHA